MVSLILISNNATQRNATQRNATQRNATQRNATQRNANNLNFSVYSIYFNLYYVYSLNIYFLICYFQISQILKFQKLENCIFIFKNAFYKKFNFMEEIMSQKTTKRVFTRKSKLFLILASMILALSCKNPLGDESGGSGSGGAGGGGSGGGQTITNEQGKVFPAWYLTAEQQQQNFSMGPTIVFQSRKNPRKQYRIPAIIVADNGNIIAIADDRYTHGGDIGLYKGLIDIVYKVSKDGGKNWSAAKIMGNKSTNPEYDRALNKGDALVFKANDGTLVCMAVSGGGFANATDSTPSRMLRSESKDNGETWSDWKEVGQNLINKIKNSFSKDSSGKGIPKAFAPSGRGLTLKDGTFAAAMIGQVNNGGFYGLYIYSTDKGENWDCADNWIPGTGGNGMWNEPKVIAELNDGKLLMSVRNEQRGRNRMYAVSTDVPVKGKCSWPLQLSAWDNFVDGRSDAEGVVWTREKEQDKNRILHIAAGPENRKGLKLFLSRDEGKSFSEAKVLLDINTVAAYSSLDVCGDGTIVTLAEEQVSENGASPYDIVFRRYNMKAITGEVYKTEWYKDIK